VRDTGIGIPEERLSQLFQSFTQVDTSTTRKYGGTGLGLAISRHLIEMMGGSIRVESELHKGSTFFFTIVAETSTENIPLRSYHRSDHPLLVDKHVLIVDDNETNRRILSHQIKVWGMIPHTVASAADALNMIRQDRHFDFALLDVHMPDMDGVTLAEKLITVCPYNLPTVLLSSVDQISELSREVGKHTHVILKKPIKPSLLYNALIDFFSDDSSVDTFDKIPDTSLAHNRMPNLADTYPLRILVAEDNAINQKVILRLLERMGYQADVAANGVEVLQALRRLPYSVILMDVQMPEMDGIETTRRIHEEFSVGCQPYIIALTAHALEGDRERLLSSGMDDYVSKPIRMEDLVAALKRVLPRGNAGTSCR
jgi:CheY-like chemotaxis protein